MWSPRGKPPVSIPETDVFKAIVESQWDGQRHRLPGVNGLRRQHPEIPPPVLARLIAEVKAEMLRNQAKATLMVRYCEPHLIWSMDIFQYCYQGINFHVLQVIDLGSRFKFEPAIKVGAFSGPEVADHLNMLCRQHDAPLFLKRDNGSNLNDAGVFDLMQMFAIIPLNSPPGCPQYNGVMERSQGEIKRYLRVTLTDHALRDVFAADVYYSVNRANQRPRPVLDGKTAWKVFTGEFKHYTKREREEIYNEIKNMAADIYLGVDTPPAKQPQTVESSWRKAARKWLEKHHFIEPYRDGKPLRQEA